MRTQRLAVLASILLVGCAASPENLKKAAVEETARMQPPSKPLSGFGSFELMPMKLSAAVAADDRKVAEARDLEGRLRAKVRPLLNEWNQKSDRTGPPLVVEPWLASLRVVSGGARFWAGGMAGESNVDMTLKLTDKGSDSVVAQPRVQRTAGGMAGGWSVGKTDQNLLDYIAAIAYEYLASNY